MGIKITLISLNVILMFTIILILYVRERSKTKKLRTEFETLKSSFIKSKEDTDIETKIRQLKDKADAIINDTRDDVTNNITKLSNQKIMEFEEYANTLFEKIELNHKEVVFLYDMLNDKSNSIKVQFQKLQDARKEVEGLLNKVECMVTKDSSVDDKEVVEKEEFKEVLEFCKTINDEDSDITKVEAEDSNDEVQIPVKEINSDYQVQNEKIIKLYSLGYTTKEISKKLGIGTGQVALVNNLYKNRVMS